MTNIFIPVVTHTWKVIERHVNAIDKTFHEIRKPVTTPICRFFILLHMNQSHVTALRLVIIITFLPLWILEHYHLAVLLLAINIVLDIVDGDLARILNKDSDIRKFEDVTVDNIVVVVAPLALIWTGLISGFAGAYYIFIATFSWWLSVVRGNHTLKSNWLFRAQASSFLFFTRFCIITSLMFLYALFKLDVFSQTIIILSIILTLSTIYDYCYIIRARL